MSSQITTFNSQFEIQELKKLFHFNTNLDSIVSITTDSRNIKKDQIFLPLKGEKYDGHNFINQAFEKVGASDYLPLMSFCEEDKSSKVKKEHHDKLIVVENTLDTYHSIANYYRKKINPIVIAITGSSGKTTTKDLVATVLASKYKTHKTDANFNNEIGVPKTILEMPTNTRILVLELGMRGLGEIEYLAKTCEPDIAVITNIGTAHIGRLGSIESIIKAKCEILKHLKKDGIAVLYNDPDLLQYCKTIWSGKTAVYDLSQGRNISFSQGRSHFEIDKITTSMGEKYSVNALGKLHVLNSLCAVLIGKYLHLSKDEIQRGLSNFKVSQGRGNVIKLPNNVFLVDESYNANPDSVKTSVSNLIDCWESDYKKIFVLGELAELGKHEKELLEELGNWLKVYPLTNIITIGNKCRDIASNISAIHAKNVNECCDILEKMLMPKTIVVVKGSNVAGLEKVVEYFTSAR